MLGVIATMLLLTVVAGAGALAKSRMVRRITENTPEPEREPEREDEERAPSR
jgi:hypothetical protein